MQHNRHVARVEEAYRIATAHSTLARALERNLDAEALEVDDSGEDDERREQVHDVGQILAVECLLERNGFIGPGQEQMEQRDDRTFKFRAAARVDRCWRKGFPYLEI